MADKKISQLSEKIYLSGNDVVPILDSEASNENKKTKLSSIQNLCSQLVLEYSTTTPSIVLSPNYCIKFSSPITSLTITSLSVSPLESEVQFTTDSSSFTFTATPLEGKWLGVDSPTFELGTSYVIAVKNGYAVLGKVGA